MFICQCCKKSTKPGEKQTRVIDVFRDVEYHHEKGISKGTEIVKEIILGPCCLTEVPFYAVPEMQVKVVHQS